MIKPMRRLSSSFVVILLAALALFAGPGAAQSLNVDIVGGVETATPIVVVPFAQAGGAPLSTDIADVIRNDFNRSGKFRSLAKSDIVEFPAKGADIKFATWRLLKQDYITVGRVSDAGGGMLRVEYELSDVNRQQSLLRQAFTGRPGPARRGPSDRRPDLREDHRRARRLLDPHRLYHRRRAGQQHDVFADGGRFGRLQPAGGRPLEGITAVAVVVAGRQEDRLRVVRKRQFEHLRAGHHHRLTPAGGSASQGINGAPAWSPDGSKLAVALSYVGNLELFVLDWPPTRRPG